MMRKLLASAALLLLAACATSRMPNFGQIGCLRTGRDKAVGIGSQAGARSAPGPTVADVGTTLVSGVAVTVLELNRVNVGIVIAQRRSPLDLCHPNGLMRGLDPVCYQEPLAKP